MQNQTDAAVRLRLLFLMDGSEDKKTPKKQYRCTKMGNKKSFCAAYEG